TFIDQGRMALAQLTGELLADLVDRGVKVLAILLCVNIRPWHREMGFHREALARSLTAVKGKYDMSGQDFGQTFERLKLLRDMVANGGREAKVPWIDMDLHSRSTVGCFTARKKTAIRGVRMGPSFNSAYMI